MSTFISIPSIGRRERRDVEKWSLPALEGRDLHGLAILGGFRKEGKGNSGSSAAAKRADRRAYTADIL